MRHLLFFAFLLVSNTLLSQHIEDRTQWGKHLNGDWKISGYSSDGSLKMNGDVSFKKNKEIDLKFGLQMYDEKNILLFSGALQTMASWLYDKKGEIEFSNKIWDCHATSTSYVKTLKKFENEFKSICHQNNKISENAPINSQMIKLFSPNKMIFEIYYYESNITFTINVVKKRRRIHNE